MIPRMLVTSRPRALADRQLIGRSTQQLCGRACVASGRLLTTLAHDELRWQNGRSIAPELSSASADPWLQCSASPSRRTPTLRRWRWRCWLTYHTTCPTRRCRSSAPGSRWASTLSDLLASSYRACLTRGAADEVSFTRNLAAAQVALESVTATHQLTAAIASLTAAVRPLIAVGLAAPMDAMDLEPAAAQGNGDAAERKVSA